MRNGDSDVHRFYDEEEHADGLLAQDRRMATVVPDDDIYLSREQLHLRRSREVVNVNGVPDGRLKQGLYRRAYNPEAGSRPQGPRQGDI